MTPGGARRRRQRWTWHRGLESAFGPSVRVPLWREHEECVSFLFDLLITVDQVETRPRPRHHGPTWTESDFEGDGYERAALVANSGQHLDASGLNELGGFGLRAH